VGLATGWTLLLYAALCEKPVGKRKGDPQHEGTSGFCQGEYWLMPFGDENINRGKEKKEERTGKGQLRDKK
jgi:hypothetical protein